MKTEARNEGRIGTRSTEECKRSAGEELTQCDYIRLYAAHRIYSFSCLIEDWENKYLGYRGTGACIR
jgi:hypothetical protein